MMKAMNKSNEHVLAGGACFNEKADSHLVCVQNDDGNYQTQAISIHNQLRKGENGARLEAAGSRCSAWPLFCCWSRSDAARCVRNLSRLDLSVFHCLCSSSEKIILTVGLLEWAALWVRFEHRTACCAALSAFTPSVFHSPCRMQNLRHPEAHCCLCPVYRPHHTS